MNRLPHSRQCLLALLLSGCAPAVWPAIATCTTGTTLDNYQPAALDSGCAAVDKSFSNFVVNAQPDSAVGTPATITLTSNSTLGDILTPTGGLAVAEFTSPAFTQANTPNGQSEQTDISYVVQANTGGTLGGYTYTNGVNGYVSPAAGAWGISTITLDVSRIVTTGAFGTSTFVGSEQFCLGTTAGVVGCPTADYGLIEIILEADGAGGTDYITFECTAPGGTISAGCNQPSFSANNSGTIITFTLPGTGVEAVSVTDTFNLNAQSGGSITLDGLNNDFGEETVTPEPSSFLLAGPVMFAMLLLQRKRRE
jgi:hypothetical protein